MFRVKEMCLANAGQRTKRRSQVLMIACRQNSTTTPAKASDALTVGNTQTIAWVHRKQPKLIEVSRLKDTEHGVITIGVYFTVARSDIEDFLAMVIGD